MADLKERYHPVLILQLLALHAPEANEGLLVVELLAEVVQLVPEDSWIFRVRPYDYGVAISLDLGGGLLEGRLTEAPFSEIPNAWSFTESASLALGVRGLGPSGCGGDGAAERHVREDVSHIVALNGRGTFVGVAVEL